MIYVARLARCFCQPLIKNFFNPSTKITVDHSAIETRPREIKFLSVFKRASISFRDVRKVSSEGFGVLPSRGSMAE